MDTKETAEQLNKAIKGWLKGNDKLVVATDGYTGVGKTTLLKNLINLNKDILPINRDDFLLSRTTVKKLVKQAEDRSQVFELQVCDTEKIEEFVNAFRNGEKSFSIKVYDPNSGDIGIPKNFDLSKKVLVIEGVFMFHPKLTNHLWDKRVYLKGNIKEIDERRVRREKEQWGKDYFPESHSESYFRQVTMALKRYQKLYKSDKSADLILEI